MAHLSRDRSILLSALALLACFACAPDLDTPSSDPGAVDSETEVAPEDSRVHSLLGKPLEPVEIDPDVRQNFEAKLAAARADYEADPENADALIWYGRRLAYLGRYSEAIDVYTRGLELHPEDARLYRHRGHRFITTRQLERAIADFERAAALIEGEKDEIEPDGLPNARGIPTSTLQSNIWYHLGLARYLRHDFEGALAAYRECLEVSTNPDMLVATSHWLYMTLRRLGMDGEAAAILEPITADLDIIENQDYHRLLLLYRGDLSESEVLGADSDGPGSAAARYGVGNWHLYESRPKRAREIFLDLLETEQWAAFGYLAAESEVALASPKAN